MERGRSVYNFNLNCDVNKALEVVQGYINGNGFTLINDKNESYYRAGDAMRGYRYFNYRLTGNNLEISAWLKGMTGEFSLENGGISIPIMSYRNSINELLQAIANLNANVSATNINGNNIGYNQNPNAVNNNGVYNQNTGQPIYQNYPNNNSNQTTGVAQNNTIQPNYNQNNSNQFAQNFQNANIKKQETLCEVGFWLSVIGLFCAFFEVYYGIISIIFIFYFAYQGLNTPKRSKAIASFALSIVSIIIMIVQLIAM